VKARASRVFFIFMNVSPVVVLAVGPEGEWPLLAMHRPFGRRHLIS